MPTYTPSSGTIRFSDIRNAFGLTTVSLAARRSQIYWRSDAFRGTLPSSTIKLSDFYAKSGTSPVVPQNGYWSANNGTVQGITDTQTWTVPLYYKMQIDCRAAGGGGAGGSGGTLVGSTLVFGDGAGGNNGGNTSWGSYNIAYGGTGGAQRGNGVRAASGAGSDGLAYGGSGGAGGNDQPAGGAGGNGGFSSVTVYSPVNGGTGPAPGSVVTIISGAGGSGGAGYGTGGAGSPGRYGEQAIYIT